MSELQFENPGAPDYDWQKDREWFNQRLANAGIQRHELEQRIGTLRGALKAIAAGKMTKPAMRELARDAVEKDGKRHRAGLGERDG